MLATAVAAYIVLLGAHARGLAGYWRTVPVIERPPAAPRSALPADELPIGLLHLGDAAPGAARARTGGRRRDRVLSRLSPG